MIKKILVAQDGSNFSKSALDYALWLAGSFKAVVTGIYVVDIVAFEAPFLHDISGALGFEPFLNFSTKIREELEKTGRTILKSFRESCEAKGVECEEHLGFGIVTNEICEKARVNDLVIVGRRGLNARFEYGLLGSVTEGVVRKSPKPVLVVPEVYKKIENPLLAYDGSANASKAMHSAAEILKTLGLPLTVVAVTNDEKDRTVIEEAENYLKTYGIEAKLEPLTGIPPVAIERYYRDNDHDLIFMGASSHSRLVEMVIGSTTEHVMRAVEGPVFIER